MRSVYLNLDNLQSSLKVADFWARSWKRFPGQNRVRSPVSPSLPQVVERLREKILSGELPEGEQLRQETIGR